METNQTPTPNQPQFTQEQMLEEILKISQQTKNYMKWQLYITTALVVLPLLGVLVAIPTLMKSLSTLGGVYGSGGLLQ